MTSSNQVAVDSSRKFMRFFKAQDDRKINHLVFHHIAAQNADEAIAMLEIHEVSSHFLIDETGKIFCLVDEKDVAFHAGTSFWRGYEGLNQTSIGIEFVNSSPFSKKFEEVQLLAGLELAKFLVEKYQIQPYNIVGHSDIAYDPTTGFLDRKQDPSHFFDWGFFSKNGVGISLEIAKNLPENHPQKFDEAGLLKALFSFGDRNKKIFEIKFLLKNFGYRLQNLDENFDEEMRNLVRVFNRRFLPASFLQDYSSSSDLWYVGSQLLLENL